MFAGRKEWRLFPSSQAHLLDPHWPPIGAAVRDAVFGAQPFRPWREQCEAHPGLALATPYRLVLEPGDLLFVPAGWPHAVRNLPGPPTVALSANYVDGTNIERHLRELRWQAISEAEQEPRAAGEQTFDGGGGTAGLLRAFEAAGFDRSMALDGVEDTAWANFKKQGRV